MYCGMLGRIHWALPVTACLACRVYTASVVFDPVSKHEKIITILRIRRNRAYSKGRRGKRANIYEAYCRPRANPFVPSAAAQSAHAHTRERPKPWDPKSQLPPAPNSKNPASSPATTPIPTATQPLQPAPPHPPLPHTPSALRQRPISRQDDRPFAISLINFATAARTFHANVS